MSKLRACVGLAALLVLACGARREPRPGSEAQWSAHLASPERAAEYARLERYLDRRGVGDIVPAWHLCRQGTDWETAGVTPFAIPPEREWPKVVPTLRFLRDHVVPAVGPVEVVSGYRTREYNAHAGGARSSRHLHFDAIDVVPVRGERERLHARLDTLWRGPGRRARLGLGLYGGARFHVDTHRHRRW